MSDMKIHHCNCVSTMSDAYPDLSTWILNVFSSCQLITHPSHLSSSRHTCDDTFKSTSALRTTTRVRGSWGTWLCRMWTEVPSRSRLPKQRGPRWPPTGHLLLSGPQTRSPTPQQLWPPAASWGWWSSRATRWCRRSWPTRTWERSTPRRLSLCRRFCSERRWLLSPTSPRWTCRELLRISQRAKPEDHKTSPQQAAAAAATHARKADHFHALCSLCRVSKLHVFKGCLNVKFFPVFFI